MWPLLSMEDDTNSQNMEKEVEHLDNLRETKGYYESMEKRVGKSSLVDFRMTAIINNFAFARGPTKI